MRKPNSWEVAIAISNLSNTAWLPMPKPSLFRRYDKCALDKAVASVRSGEMSVHRAGSFYGVPHSTLEYKVKERNLLRNKQRRPVQQTNSGSGSGNESTTDSASAPPTAAEVLVA